MSDWHRDYVAESIKREERDPFREDPSFYWLQYIAPRCPHIADHARTIALEAGDDHGTAVAETVRGIAHGIERTGKGTISPKQGFVVGRILAERYGSARGLAAALYGLSDQEIDDADI